MPSGYLDDVMDVPARRKIVADLCETLRKLRKRTKIDAIVCRGISGMSVSFQVSDATDIRMVVVRKTNEVCHGWNVEFGSNSIEQQTHPIKNYVVIDDVITTGETMEFIMAKMQESTPNMPTIILYGRQSKASIEYFLKRFEGNRKPRVIGLNLY